MEKAEKYDKIVNEMRELLKEKEMLKEIKNQKKLLEDKEKLKEIKEIKERELLKRLKIKAEKIYFEKAKFDIPYFIRNVEYEDITTLRAKRKYLQKCKEFALLNDVPIILVVNFLLLYLWRKM